MAGLFSSFSVCVVAADEDKPASPTPLSKLKLDTTKLKSWNTRKYRLEVGADANAAQNTSMTLTTRVQDAKIQFEDELDLTNNDGRFTMNIKADAKPDAHLSLAAFQITANLGGENARAAGALADNRLEFSLTKDTQADHAVIQLPENTTTLFALMRLVTLLPRDAGKSYLVDSVIGLNPADKPDLNGAHVIQCKGIDPELAATGIKWTRYHVFVRDNPADLTSVDLWVGPDAVLQKLTALNGNLNATLIPPPPAEAPAKKDN